MVRLSDDAVASVEDKLNEHLDSQGLGLAFTEPKSVRQIFDGIRENLGGMVEGDGALENIVRLRAAEVAKVVEEAKREQEQGVLRVQEQGGQQPLGGVEAIGADPELLETRHRLLLAEREIERLQNLLAGAGLTTVHEDN